MRLLKTIFAISILFVLPLIINAQDPQIPILKSTFGHPQLYGNRWVDSVFNSLSLDERIAQLFFIRTYSNKDKAYYDEIGKIIRENKVGGLTFFQGSPTVQANLTNQWQSISKTPLLITIDGEWGLGMRLDSAYSFPRQMTLGAMPGDTIVYEVGRVIGKHCKRLGIGMNFAPDADINSNSKNPVINYRSFGQDAGNVARKTVAWFTGLQEEGVIATAKHFPGHGDTDTDSHVTLPLLNHSRQQIDSIDLYPFKKAIEAGVGSIMVAHLFVPALDDEKNIATSLSVKAVQNLLKDSLGFEGLAITDALDMKGVTNYHKPGDIELKALLAGNDIILLPLDIPLAVSNIKKALADSLISEDEINKRCRKVLAYKQMTGLDQLKPINTKNILADINTVENELLTRKIYENAVTIVKNTGNLIPLQQPDTLKIASLVIGYTEKGKFQESLSLFSKVEHFNLPSNPDEAQMAKVVKALEDFNLIIISLQKTNNSNSKQYGISDNSIKLISRLKNGKNKLIVDVFANPYSLELFGQAEKIDALMVSYEDNPISEEISAQIIFGSIGAVGRLPVTASETFRVGDGTDTKSIGRLKYTIPEELDIPREKLKVIDSLINLGLKEKAFPGCQVVFAKDGKVFYNKSFGFHTYDKTEMVVNSDLYDVASLTKVMATTLSVMRLSEIKQLDIDQPLSSYLPYLKNTDKKSKISREIMSHQAQLYPFIPFYKNTIKNCKPDTSVYSPVPKAGYSKQVTEKLFITNAYHKTIFDSIANSKLLKKKEYKYSDLGFMLLCDAIETITSQPFAEFTSHEFYEPLGLTTTCFNPTGRFPLSQITPTENDTLFRKGLIHGYVHDQGAAMLGGVSGHAGLFSNAGDLAVIMQMLLQKGYYGGKQFFLPQTVKEFTKQQFPLENNRRALGFDKPYPNYDSLGPVCKSASHDSFGHSGFTGTYLWADPENGLIFIFLSNRVYPDANNQKLIKMGLRTMLHQAMYDILKTTGNQKSSKKS
jgi:beta-glucosidase-like glycosyl hydrolase/CubicO group peptidase (beta-lactamase class C family)